MFLFIAQATASNASQTGTPNDLFMQFIPLVAMLAIFYFLLIRPQQKRTKQHKSMLEALKPNDKVITTGGLIGRITSVDHDTLTLDLGETKVSISRAYIVGLTENK